MATFSASPVAVTGITNASRVVSGGSSDQGSFCAILTTGAMKCWGDNIGGELGAGLDPTVTLYSPAPVAVSWHLHCRRCGEFLGPR